MCALTVLAGSGKSLVRGLPAGSERVADLLPGVLRAVAVDVSRATGDVHQEANLRFGVLECDGGFGQSGDGVERRCGHVSMILDNAGRVKAH